MLLVFRLYPEPSRRVSSATHAVGKRPVVAAALAYFAATALGLYSSIVVSADEPVRADKVPLLEVNIGQGDRRSEVKRALRTGDNYHTEPEARRRLSADERDLLNRELREAMAGIYDSRGAERQPK